MQDMLTDGSNRRVFEVWPGKNRFAFDGRWICGPADDLGPQLCVGSLVAVGAVSYYGFVVHYLLDGWLLVFPVLTTSSILLMVVAYIAVHVTDPGIIPRRSFLEDTSVLKRKDIDLSYLLEKEGGQCDTENKAQEEIEEEPKYDIEADQDRPVNVGGIDFRRSETEPIAPLAESTDHLGHRTARPATTASR